MNEKNIIDALNAYDGTQPSLEKTVSVLSAEVGPDWMNQIFEQLGDLPVELKEKLDHAFNYYASLMAWQEAQSYLNQSEPLDAQMMEERLPILQHWLDFFGQPGQELYQKLKSHFEQQTGEGTVPASDDSGQQAIAGVDSNNVETSSLDAELNEPENIDANVAQESGNPLEAETIPNNNTISSDEVIVNKEPSENEEVAEVSDDRDDHFEDGDDDYSDQNDTMPEDDTPEGFAVRKAEREIVLLDDLQAWLAARCHQLGDIETFAYPYYGMLVDLMRQVVKDIQSVLDLENQDIVAKYYPDGLEPLIRKKEAVEADIQTAVENCESNTTALIEEGMDMNKVKKALGDLDESTEKEYLGPAPDGFELMEDKPIDEEAVKEQYEQLEEDAQKNTQKQDISVTDEKKTSQNDQNGVQRKLSFSLKPKKG